MIETVDSVTINDPGKRHDVALENTVKDIDPALIENEESKRLLKEMKDELGRRKPESRPASAASSPNKASLAVSGQQLEKERMKAADMAELNTITKQVLDDMERLAQSVDTSYAKVVDSWPEVFARIASNPNPPPQKEERLPTVKELRAGAEEEQKSSAPKRAPAGTPRKEAKKSVAKLSAAAKEEAKKTERKRRIIKPMDMGSTQSLREVVTEGLRSAARVTSIKKILQYQKEAKKGVSALLKSNGFIPERPHSRAKDKYDVARQIDSSINQKKQ
ncbi:MAG: hypothetical protein P4M11_10355 [Candidatus Pacebacteria bacterium]|nr:hypothetical protein [Candidatus Paceibacterota bacterium]